MDSESAKELLKWQNSVMVCIQGKRKDVILLFLLNWGGGGGGGGGEIYRFFMIIALAIPPLTVKNKRVR